MDAPPPLPAQNMMVKPVEETITNNTTTKAAGTTCVKRKVEIRPEKDVKAIINCPRCNSSNTKFCYYNNYSLTQPRYFCKACKRYWTQGGSLRNIPVGGKIRKNKTHSIDSKIKLPAADQLLHHQPSSINPNYPKSLIHHAQDLNLGDFIASTHHQYPYDDHHIHHKINAHDDNTSNYLSAMELLTGINNNASSRGLVMAPYMPIQHISDPNSNAVYPVGFPFQGDFRPSLSFSLDGSKTADDHHQYQDHISNQQITRDRAQQEDSTGYNWTGNILGGAGSW